MPFSESPALRADAALRLSSLDDFTALAIEQQSLFPVGPSLPPELLHQTVQNALTGCVCDWLACLWGHAQVVTSEIGDTWVHGTASDPTRARRSDLPVKYLTNNRFGRIGPFLSRRYRQAVRTIVDATSARRVDASDRRIVEALTLLLKMPEHTYGSNDGLVVGWPWDNAAFDRLAANKVCRMRTTVLCCVYTVCLRPRACTRVCVSGACV